MDLVKKMILSKKQSVNALSTSYIQVLQKGHPESGAPFVQKWS